ncbi:MAG: hypothetical protein COV99_11565 [Bacteroidetes bacterium CG12_big_fil_rev_8_21_14_0_65_60_17]|nr:MAG: hypothetical protein COV99_11565 [Bacteroidetes bacterium CG12_big_fil_rev_8_21_14_0_65_60_17]
MTSTISNSDARMKHLIQPKRVFTATTAAVCTLVLLATALSAPAILAQDETPWTPLKPGSDNMAVEGHVPLGLPLNTMDLDIEQELSRPYVYVSRGTVGEGTERGTDIIDISDPSSPKVLKRWRIESQELHTGLGGMDVKYFKWNDRYYVVQSTQFGPGPNNDLGAYILDVTGLPDAATVREAGRIHEPDLPGGFHNIFVYKHSNGRVYLFTTVSGPNAHIYDLGSIVDGDSGNGFVGTVPVPLPGGETSGSYHDLYVAWHPDTEEDRFYGGGTGGYYVYDVTDVENPELEITLTGITGVRYGHTFTPSPDGRYVVTETEYQYAPLRMFDLKPALDGDVTNIRQPISAWTANWQNLVHNHEVRWPFVFVSGYHDGLQVFSMMDPENPVTVGYYDTYTGSRKAGVMEGAVANGAFGVDVRNADGLIVISDMTTGFWTFRMEGFNGWNGEDWGQPNISSAQQFDEESKEGTK